MRLIDNLQQRLFRWKTDGTAPIRLDQRRIFILPSQGGLLYSLALVVMLLGAINYNLALGHALVFLLAGLGLTGMVHTFRNLHGLGITAGRCTPVFVGETAQFELIIDNNRPTPRRDLNFAAEKGLSSVIAVNGHDQAKILVPLPARQRGWLTLPRIHLSTRYPLGLFTAWSYLQPAMRCLAYPQPITTTLPESTLPTKGNASHGLGGQEDFAGFRERQPADALRHVAWKASARNNGQRPLLIKLFAGGSDAELSLDWSATDPGQSVETRLSILAGWVLEANGLNLTYGLRLPGREIPAANGQSHSERCLEALALFSP
ncbi:DUF58 domain-containing protein [Azonexus sp.]|uniref:DUF58 domain-containing protein n=1 Tax=Azonexus sp. TaxID=1872668 RepID=UPI0027B9C2F5|nr:DUF58 domain-containing protein [Azonexus sp.]